MSSQIVVLDDVAALPGSVAGVLERYQAAAKALSLSSKPGFPTNTLTFFTRDR